MPLVHHAQREITLKLVYCGAGLGGKTTNLRELHAQSRPARRGKLISLATDAKRTLFFDFLPIELGDFRGYRFRAHVCSVPGQIAKESIRERVLRHTDGVVLVVDSQPKRAESNMASLRDVELHLRQHGLEPERVPLVVQYNKRDLPEALEIDELREALGVPEEIMEVEASARLGWGVFETLKTAVRESLRELDRPTSLAEGHSPCLRARPRQRFYAAPSTSVIRALKPEAEMPAAKSGAKD